MKSQLRFALVLTMAVAFFGVLIGIVLWLPDALAQEGVGEAPQRETGEWGLGLLAAALATGLSSISAAYAVAKIGTAAMGTLAEKPELFGRLVVFVGLAEGIAIYGLIVSVLILNRLA
jgi:V/A-type H+-transporting ATPase subunit K